MGPRILAQCGTRRNWAAGAGTPKPFGHRGPSLSVHSGRRAADIPLRGANMIDHEREDTRQDSGEQRGSDTGSHLGGLLDGLPESGRGAHAQARVSEEDTQDNPFRPASDEAPRRVEPNVISFHERTSQAPP